jgi:hypothetical protein
MAARKRGGSTAARAVRKPDARRQAEKSRGAAVRRARRHRILNCVPSVDVERDWTPEHAVRAGLLRARARLPEEKDLRASWWTVGDQGATGSCVGWAAADSVLRWHFVQAGRIRRNQTLSARYVWMAAKETDEFEERPTTFIEVDGTSLKAALDVARKFGVVTSDVLPFGGLLYQDEPEVFYALAARLKIASYINVGRTPQRWREWIATRGPVLTRLEVDDEWDRAGAGDGRLDVYRPPPEPAGHAVALVGYTRDRFIVRNSWGRSWGDGGFAYASLAYAQAAFTEAYGVTV